MTINIQKIKNKKSSNVLLNSFLGNLIKQGSSGNAYKVYVEILESLKSNIQDQNPKFVFLDILAQVKPVVGIRMKKVAGINYQLPCPISEERSCKVAISWFFKSLDNRSEKILVKKIIGELLDIRKNKGYSLQKKQSLEKVALDNRPFLHFLKR